MSAHYCLVTVWSQSGSSREGKAECHCPVGVVMIWKIIIIVDYSVFFWASQMYLLCFCESLKPRNTDLTKNRTAQELHRMLTCAVKANGRHSPSRRRCASCESGLFRAQTALESQMCLLCFRETLTLRRTGRQKSCTGCSPAPCGEASPLAFTAQVCIV